MANLTPYRSLSSARRVALLTHALTAHRESRATYIQRLVARGGGFRAASLQSWPADRLAREVVRLNAESGQDELELLQLLYVDLEPAIQSTFLNTAGVANENGKIADDIEPPYANAEAASRAAAAVHAQHGDDGLRYIRTLVRYNLAAWPGLDTVLADIEDHA